jgi:hypothetical protein
VNAAILLALYWNQLDGGCKPAEEVVAVPTEVVEEEDVTSHRFSPATMSHLLRRGSQQQGAAGYDEAVPVVVHQDPVKPANGVHHRRNGTTTAAVVNGKDPVNPLHEDDPDADADDWNSKAWKTCVYVITLGMLVALLLGLNMSWSAITAALALIVLDFKDARPCLEKVSYPLLLFFCGMFITVDGFNKTGIPSAFWEFMEPYARIDTPTGTAVLAAVILLLSNVASNVPTGQSVLRFTCIIIIIILLEMDDCQSTTEITPTVLLLCNLPAVLLLGARVAASAAAISPAAETNAWLILAWTSTVAGNLSLLGSAANLIVCEQARRSQQYGYTLSFFSHLQFGFPATLVVTGIGLLLIRTY